MIRNSDIFEKTIKNSAALFPKVEHIAILSKKRQLLAKILSGEKTIESRWYETRRTPWSKIALNDIVYFKDSGDAVTAKAKVAEVLFFELTPKLVKELITKYGASIGLTAAAYEKLKGKRYCILIFLKDVERIAPFEIDKSGFGNMAAWITTKNVVSLRK